MTHYLVMEENKEFIQFLNKNRVKPDYKTNKGYFYLLDDKFKGLLYEYNFTKL